MKTIVNAQYWYVLKICSAIIVNIFGKYNLVQNFWMAV